MKRTVFMPVVIVAALPLASLATGSPTQQDSARSACQMQAATLLQRLQREVLGEMTTEQANAAGAIVLEVCQAQEEAADEALEQAVMQAREEEQEKASSWLTESAKKPGNARLKRKSH
ncbi:MAG: hypothetical protein NXI15_03150 [Gammaproteobacteria bacterium]|jgi:hypothetical protein|nr:hypothetical protein [Gammaproteobacteria bacterium]